VWLVIDFPGAHWADGIALPAPTAPVKGVRTGQVDANTARLVLEVPSAAVKVTRVEQSEDGVLASVGTGKEAAPLPLDPLPNSQITAIQRRKRGLTSIASRHLDDSSLRSRLPLEMRGLPTDALAGKVICVDPGHGGHSAGAQGLNNYEKDLCLKMALQFKAALEACGATVIMTRDSDVYVSLEERCEIAARNNVDLFISIHCNSMPRRNTQSGSETYFTTPQSLPLAQAMHRRLVGAVQGRDGDVRTCRFFVCRNVAMPSVLLEIAYINNSEDERLLADSQFHANLGQSLALGVVEYFGK